ncbi:hypothetical protein [Streptomyces sp. NPDC001435]
MIRMLAQDTYEWALVSGRAAAKQGPAAAAEPAGRGSVDDLPTV